MSQKPRYFIYQMEDLARTCGVTESTIRSYLARYPVVDLADLVRFVCRHSNEEFQVDLMREMVRREKKAEPRRQAKRTKKRAAKKDTE